jgi:hypothetical protein
MAPKQKADSEEDWFAKLDAELEKKTQAINKDKDELNFQQAAVTKVLIEDFCNIQNRFDRIKVPMNMDPGYGTFAMYAERDTYPQKWTFKPGFDFESVNIIQLVDMSQVQGRTGDSLKAWFYMDDMTPHIRMVFNYCEGERYYRYDGWKRIFGQYVIYDAPLAKFDEKVMHDRLYSVVVAWYESHLKSNRDILINHLKEKYEKGGGYTE